jgi:DNA primase
MKLEVEKAYKRRLDREKRKQEKADLAPAQNLQPKTRQFRYDNMKSAMAEEAVLAMVLKEPAMFAKTAGLAEDMFSSSVLGKAFAQLRSRYSRGLEVSAAVLEDFTAEEMSHLAHITQRHTGPVNEAAMVDCVRTITDEHRSNHVQSDRDLLEIQKRMQQRKGT